MYAIVQQGGHQYRVSPGDRLVVDRLEAAVGSVIALEPVLLLQGETGDATVGSPIVDGARVAAIVVSHSRGKKIRVFKYKPKKRYRRTQGHRSHLTELRVEALLAAGEPLPEIPAPLAVVEAEEVEAAEVDETAVAEAAVQETEPEETEPVATAAKPKRSRAAAAKAKAETKAEAEVGTDETAAGGDTTAPGETEE
jgi:large subunit ribosomal protein L21